LRDRTSLADELEELKPYKVTLITHEHEWAICNHGFFLPVVSGF